MIELKNVETIYEGERTPVIKNINLEIKKGEFLTIIGPNGAGKTTLLETINGLLEARGKILIFGKDIKKYGTKIRKNIGYVPQDFSCDSLTPFLVKDVVMMGRFGKIGILKSPSKKDHEIVKKTLSFLGISELEKKPIGKLSGGQLQKVMIARALAKEPEMLLLDEPFSNLDLNSRSDISEKISFLNEEGMTMIMVVHDISSIPERCKRIVMINNGKIIEDNEREKVLGGVK